MKDKYALDTFVLNHLMHGPFKASACFHTHSPKSKCAYIHKHTCTGTHKPFDNILNAEAKLEYFIIIFV